MLYRLHFADIGSHPLTLTGFKVVEDDPGLDSVWSDTSTLFTRVLKGHVEAVQDSDAELVAAGILHIQPLDFARQLTTFRTEPPGRLDAIARFGALFAGELWEVYGGRASGERRVTYATKVRQASGTTSQEVGTSRRHCGDDFTAAGCGRAARLLSRCGPPHLPADSDSAFRGGHRHVRGLPLCRDSLNGDHNKIIVVA